MTTSYPEQIGVILIALMKIVKGKVMVIVAEVDDVMYELEYELKRLLSCE